MAAHGQGDAHGSWGTEADDEPPATTQPLPVVSDEGSGRGRLARFILRLIFTLATLAALLAIGFGLLLAFTPSAGQALQRTAQLAASHHESYPGPVPPATFTQALVATEDHRFYSRAEVAGIDPLALAHEGLSQARGSHQGGATIALQLAKLLYIGSDSPRHDTLEGDLLQLALGVKLSAAYSKPQLLTMYAEAAYYGHGYYGLQAASCGYFGRPPSALTLTQGAMLAGVVNAPAFDDPVSHPAAARARLAHVIGRMVTVGYLSPAQGRAALAAPLGLAPGNGSAC